MIDLNDMTLRDLIAYKNKINNELNNRKNKINDTKEFKILFKKVKKYFYANNKKFLIKLNDIVSLEIRSICILFNPKIDEDLVDWTFDEYDLISTDPQLNKLLINLTCDKDYCDILNIFANELEEDKKLQKYLDELFNEGEKILEEIEIFAQKNDYSFEMMYDKLYSNT